VQARKKPNTYATREKKRRHEKKRRLLMRGGGREKGEETREGDTHRDKRSEKKKKGGEDRYSLFSVSRAKKGVVWKGKGGKIGEILKETIQRQLIRSVSDCISRRGGGEKGL